MSPFRLASLLCFALTAHLVVVPAQATQFLNVEITQDGDNVLRYVIDFETDVATSTRAVWNGGAGGTNRSVCGPVGTQHQTRVWGIAANRTIPVRLEDCESGEVRIPPLVIATPSLPDHLALVELQSPCDDCDTNFVLYSVDNPDGGWDLFVADRFGDLVWYQEDTGSKHAHTPRADGRGVVWVDEAASIWRMGFDGVVEEPWTRAGAGFGTEHLPADLCFHHELRDTGSELYMLSVVPYEYDDNGTLLTYLDEGVLRLGPDGEILADDRGLLSQTVAQVGLLPTEIGSQNPSQFYEGCGYGGLIDWAHGNSLWANESGGYIMGLKSWGPMREGQFLGVDDQGQQIWAFGAGGDFELTQGNWFSQAHHLEVRRYDFQGRPRLVWLYDNTGLINTRILEVALTFGPGGTAATARITREVDVGLRCEIRGGAYETDRGRLVVGCAPEGSVREIGWDFNPQTDVPYWQIQTFRSSSPDTPSGSMWRAFPLATLAPAE